MCITRNGGKHEREYTLAAAQSVCYKPIDL